MLPYLSLFGRLMPTYGVLGMAGLGFGLLAAEPGGGEKLLLRQGCPRGGAVLLQGV